MSLKPKKLKLELHRCSLMPWSPKTVFRQLYITYGGIPSLWNSPPFCVKSDISGLFKAHHGQQRQHFSAWKTNYGKLRFTLCTSDNLFTQQASRMPRFFSSAKTDSISHKQFHNICRISLFLTVTHILEYDFLGSSCNNFR